MANEPTIQFTGNLTADPELRYTQSGQPVCNFTVAVTPRTHNKQSNTWTDGETSFFRCSLWGTHGENAAETLMKGMGVYVQGRFTQRTYQDKNGAERISLDVAVGEVGPTLRFQQAQVRKTGNGSQASQNGSQQAYGSQGGRGYPQGGYGPQNGAQHPDPAGNLAQLDSQPPF